MSYQKKKRGRQERNHLWGGHQGGSAKRFSNFEHPPKGKKQIVGGSNLCPQHKNSGLNENTPEHGYESRHWGETVVLRQKKLEHVSDSLLGEVWEKKKTAPGRKENQRRALLGRGSSNDLEKKRMNGASNWDEESQSTGRKGGKR